MPKRSAEEQLIRYNKKIKKLEGKIKKKRQRSIIYSDEEDNDQVTNIEDQLSTPVQPLSVDPHEEIIVEPAFALSTNTIIPEITNEATELPNTQEALETPVEPSIELNPELLSALGASTSDSPEFRKAIHETLANLWSPLLKKGLPKEEKEKLIKEFIVPENCKNLQAPKLNAEISAAITDLARARDKKILTFQQQLGYGMTAINRAMDLLLKDDNKVSALKCLSDGCRILSDLHFAFTKDRMKLILPSLDTNFKHVIQDSERDETLFGNGLSEKIKASKAIEKQGAQIKKVGSKLPVSQPTTTRPTQQGNWVGPPRYPSNRGGAGRSEESTCGGASTSPSIFKPSGQCEIPPTQSTCTDTKLIQESASPPVQSYPGCREALRASFSRRGCPPETLPLILASLADNTISQYSVALKLWWEFCTLKKIDVFYQCRSSVLCFLNEQFNKGCSYGTLNSHRSALSLFLGEEIGNDDCIKRLLKGAYKIKPNKPKYTFTWNPNQVLNQISLWYPNINLSLEKISKKLIVLLALCTGQRVQTLSLIKLENITFETDHIKITITDIIKTSAPNREQPILSLPVFNSNLKICPVSTLKDYIFITKNIRAETTGNLFLTYKAPYKAASSQTLSRWIKQTLCASGVDISVFSAHSTRHAATSAAHAAGVTIDTIRKTAGWTEDSQVFAKFYNRPLKENINNDFAFSLLNQCNDSLQ